MTFGVSASSGVPGTNFGEGGSRGLFLWSVVGWAGATVFTCCVVY